MLRVKQTVQVIHNGKKDCDHMHIAKNIGKIALFPLTHTQERICFNCGEYEKVITKVVYENPFTFESVMNRFHKN